MGHDSHRLWVDEMPRAYRDWVAPTVFAPFAEDLAGRVVALHPRRILELAAGTGVLTRTLTDTLPGAAVLATDLNQAMVDAGADHAPAARWQQADAQVLAFDEESFDVVACQFGVMFLPDRVAAYDGIRRVLRPGGSFVFNTWAALAEHAYEVALMDALEHVLGTQPPQFLAETPHGYADPEQVRADVLAAGFADVTVEHVTLDGVAPSVRELARGYCLGTPVRNGLEDPAGIVDAVGARMAELLGDGRVTAPMGAYVVEAVRR